jgi:hypothetical protein
VRLTRCPTEAVDAEREHVKVDGPEPSSSRTPGADASSGTVRPGALTQQAVLALQKGAGNALVSRLLATAPREATIQRGLWEGIKDVFDARENEEYLDAMEDLAAFKGKTHKAKNFQSTTKLGMFDAEYDPNSSELKIICKCKFNFVNGSATEFPSAKAEDLTWADENAKTDWKRRFLTQCSNTWSGSHTFYCQKDWWEALTAKVKVDFVAVDSGEHFAVTITKIPPGGFRQSSVTAPETHWYGDTPGSGDFDSEDLTKVKKPGGEQVGAVHEAGHMLGLDDEYGTGTPSHSGLVDEAFGHKVARGSDGRIMSGGMNIQPEHGVTFLAALKEATSVEWGQAAKPPKPVPASAAGAPGTTPAPAPGVTRPSGPPPPVPAAP